MRETAGIRTRTLATHLAKATAASYSSSTPTRCSWTWANARTTTGAVEDDDEYDNSEVQPYEFYVVPPAEDEHEATVHDPTGNQTYAPMAEDKAAEQQGGDYYSITIY